jgi:hypothetical protein
MFPAHAEIESVLPENMLVQEGDGRGSDVTSTWGQVLVYQEMVEVRAHLFALDAIRRAPIKLGQGGDGVDVAFDGPWGELPQLHLPNHALT